MRTRAQRRAARNKLVRKWLGRIKAKWGRQVGRHPLPIYNREQLAQEWDLAAAKRAETHQDLRNHPRKTCSWCNPVVKRLKEEKILNRDFDRELELLDVNLHDLLSPTPD